MLLLQAPQKPLGDGLAVMKMILSKTKVEADIKFKIDIVMKVEKK